VNAEQFTDEVFDTKVLCAALTHPSGIAHLTNIIDAGVPAVIWPRNCGEDWTILKQHLTTLFDGKPRDLPVRLHESKTKNLALNHVVLLWDPYDRIPPDAGNDSALSAPDR
jgi:hypothetical protein